MSRVQTGVRVEKGLLKVLKAVAEYEEVSLGDLLERIVLCSFAGTKPFDREGIERIAELSRVYRLEVETADRLEASPALGEPGESTTAGEADLLVEGQEEGLAEALDGLSRMLGVDH